MSQRKLQNVGVMTLAQVNGLVQELGLKIKGTVAIERPTVISVRDQHKGHDVLIFSAAKISPTRWHVRALPGLIVINHPKGPAQ